MHLSMPVHGTPGSNSALRKTFIKPQAAGNHDQDISHGIDTCLCFHIQTVSISHSSMHTYVHRSSTKHTVRVRSHQWIKYKLRREGNFPSQRPAGLEYTEIVN